MMANIFAVALPWMLLPAGAWLGYQLIRQNGRILLRLESIEKQLNPRAPTQRNESDGLARSLAIGMVAPDFELPDLGGVRRRLSEFRGQDVLLIFFNPKCGFCTKLARDLAALPLEGGAERAVPVVITTGDANAVRKFVEQFGIRCVVLLQEQIEVANKYRAQGTPMGYRIDSEGRIASELTVGAEPLLELASRKAIPRPAEVPLGVGVPPVGHKGKQPDSSLARSRLNRTGLKARAVAPEFRLPHIDGGELSLADLRGRRVLLVFSDPNCGPCDDLAPHLQELHLRRSDLQVVVISRRDAEATAAKAAALGLEFPILMQQRWEISKQYGMFATPIGYLIDECGNVMDDVAVGVEPILTLAGERKPARDFAPSSPKMEAV
jgi:peroxiredoxin